jgi:hypothetical protein
MIFSQSLPGIKSFLRPLHWQGARLTMVLRLIAAFVSHCGRMSASQAAGAICAAALHRANVGRFLGRQRSLERRDLNRLQWRMLQAELRRRRGEWIFILDQTFVGHQGLHTSNTFSRGNTRPRPKQSSRRQKKTARHACHCFVMGLLITPRGCRLPCFQSYYTRDYCREHGRPYRTQTDIGAELIADLPLPRRIHVTVLGDTAFEAQSIRAACAARGYGWIVPLNPERVLEGPRGKRPKVRSLVRRLRASPLSPVRLVPGQGPYAVQHRVSRCRHGSRNQARTFYVHGERRRIRRLGEVLLVFSTKEKTASQRLKTHKLLITSYDTWSPRRVVQCYALRWQIELLFKELKSTLGMHQYQFRDFQKVERFVLACLAAFLYLEWYRQKRLTGRRLTAQQRQRCAAQRSYGLCRQVRHQQELNDVQAILRSCRTKTGLHRLRRQLTQALPLEYRQHKITYR